MATQAHDDTAYRMMQAEQMIAYAARNAKRAEALKRDAAVATDPGTVKDVSYWRATRDAWTDIRDDLADEAAAVGW